MKKIFIILTSILIYSSYLNITNANTYFINKDTPFMVEQGKKYIINISSGTGVLSIDDKVLIIKDYEEEEYEEKSIMKEIEEYFYSIFNVLLILFFYLLPFYLSYKQSKYIILGQKDLTSKK